jgi:hypothetical protein
VKLDAEQANDLLCHKSVDCFLVLGVALVSIPIVVEHSLISGNFVNRDHTQKLYLYPKAKYQLQNPPKRRIMEEESGQASGSKFLCTTEWIQNG